MKVDKNIYKKIQNQRLNILIHSYIYYELNDNRISDHEFDRRCQILVRLQEMYPVEASYARWSDEFYNWKGESGYGLPYKDVSSLAISLMNAKDINSSEMIKFKEECLRKYGKLEPLFGD